MEELMRLREVLGEGHGELIGAVEQAVEGLRVEAARAAELEAQLVEAQASAEGVAALHGEVAALRASSQAAEGRAAELAQEMAEAAVKYRDLLLASHPEIPARLVQGATIGEVEGTLAAAAEIVAEVRRQLATEQAALVPNGYGGRSGVDFATLSPIEKIKRGLAEQNGR